MTFNEVRQSLDFVERVRRCEKVSDFEFLLAEIKNYYGKKYNTILEIDSIASSYGVKYTKFEQDKKSIESFIKSLIDSEPLSSQYVDIINVIKQGTESLGNKEKEESFISFVYSAYVGKITFPKVIIDFCSGTRGAKFQVYSAIDENIVQGIIQNLKNYANELSNKSVDITRTKIENIFNPTNSVSVDVSVSVEDARKRAEEIGLSQKQLDEVNDKLKEIEDILKSKENKSKKWAKAGAILKWLAEQSVQIASFMVPLICQLPNV